MVREFIITVRMENKRVVEVHVPKRADFTRPLPTLFRNYLEELGGNPEDYSLIMRMWADARCVIESGSIDCLEPVSIKTT